MRWLVIGVTVMLVGCEKNRVYERNHAISNHEWNKDDAMHFEVNITDTVSAYDLSINVRHSAEYKNVNLWTQLVVTMPSGDTVSWRQNLAIGDNDTERWLGDCVRDICDVRVLIASDFHFAESGTYAFELSHLMWENPLHDIMSVGLRLEKQQPTSSR